MKKFSLKNKKTLAFMAAFAVLLIGGTFAISQDSSTLDNSFSIADYKTSFTETFTSPTNWITCETKEKTISVTNNSSVPVAARIGLAEVWKDADGNILPLTFTDDNDAAQKWALININTDDWTKDGYYYYYKEDLAPGATSTTFMTGVTLNCDANLNGSAYGNATYTLSATIQTIAAEQQGVWANVGATLADGPTVNAKLKTLAGTESSGQLVNADNYNIKTIVKAATLPQQFDTANPANIISADGSDPIYAWFDNANDAGIIYIYSDSAIIKSGDSIARLFQRLRALTSVPAISNWDTSQTTNMSGVFNYCTSLTSANVANWDTSNVLTMAGMFQNTYVLKSIDVSQWNTSSVTDMQYLFNHAYALESIDVSHWDTSNVTNMNSLFQKNKMLTTLDVSNWNVSKVTNMTGLFNTGDDYLGNGQLRTIVGLENWDVSEVTSMSGMFYGNGQIATYNISGWNVSKVQSFNHMFTDNFNLASLDLSGWNVSSVKTMFNMFDDCKSLTTIGEISHWNTASLIDANGFLNGATSFAGDSGILDLSGWDTSSIKSFGEMFRAVPLMTIDLTNWDFSSATNDTWEGAGSGIFSSTGNDENSAYKGLSGLFLNMPNLQHVYIDQDGKDSFDAAVARGVDVTKLWQGSPISDFTIVSNP